MRDIRQSVRDRAEQLIRLLDLNAPDVILDYLQVKIDAVITAGTFWHVYHALDFGNRYSSGGALMTTYNCDGGQAPGVLAYSGVVVATAATTQARDLGWNIIANGVGVAFAQYTIKFGRLENPPQGTFTTLSTGTRINARLSGRARI